MEKKTVHFKQKIKGIIKNNKLKMKEFIQFLLYLLKIKNISIDVLKLLILEHMYFVCTFKIIHNFFKIIKFQKHYLNEKM